MSTAVASRAKVLIVRLPPVPAGAAQLSWPGLCALAARPPSPPSHCPTSMRTQDFRVAAPRTARPPHARLQARLHPTPRTSQLPASTQPWGRALPGPPRIGSREVARKHWHVQSSEQGKPRLLLRSRVVLRASRWARGEGWRAQSHGRCRAPQPEMKGVGRGEEKLSRPTGDPDFPATPGAVPQARHPPLPDSPAGQSSLRGCGRGFCCLQPQGLGGQTSGNRDRPSPRSLRVFHPRSGDDGREHWAPALAVCTVGSLAQVPAAPVAVGRVRGPGTWAVSPPRDGLVGEEIRPPQPQPLRLANAGLGEVSLPLAPRDFCGNPNECSSRSECRVRAALLFAEHLGLPENRPGRR